MARTSKVFGHGVNDLPGSTQEGFYKVWSSMLRRAYSPVYHKKKPAYIGVSVCEDWKLLSVFKVWYDVNHVEGWELDKDLLCKGNKIYSPSTCCFLPPRVNSALIAKKSKTSLPIGVYYKIRNAKYCAQVSDCENGRRGSGYLGLYDTAGAAFAAYKQAKESLLRKLADEFKTELPARVHAALAGWKVEITD